MNPLENKKTEPFKIGGNWTAQSKQLQKQFPELTDADLKYESGQENDLLKRLETKLSKKRDEIINIVKKAKAETV
ncbi:MAG: hypothetical protein JNL69_07295 [Bacteroidia bacterium]|nr:hypothetical protein [Bacteroidia bacterium]